MATRYFIVLCYQAVCGNHRTITLKGLIDLRTGDCSTSNQKKKGKRGQNDDDDNEQSRRFFHIRIISVIPILSTLWKVNECWFNPHRWQAHVIREKVAFASIPASHSETIDVMPKMVFTAGFSWRISNVNCSFHGFLFRMLSTKYLYSLSSFLAIRQAKKQIQTNIGTTMRATLKRISDSFITKYYQRFLKSQVCGLTITR